MQTATPKFGPMSLDRENVRAHVVVFLLLNIDDHSVYRPSLMEVNQTINLHPVSTEKKLWATRVYEVCLNCDLADIVVCTSPPL